MIIRVKKGQDPYARIDKVPINDKRLTWKARGVLLYLLSKPNDWRVIIADLINQSPQGETAIKSVIKELKKYNYLKSVILRENGKITGHEYQVYERPIETPAGGKPTEREIRPAENQGRLTLEEALTNEGATNKTGSDKPTSPRKAQKFPKEDYTAVTEAYKQIKQVELQGHEWQPIQQSIKTMFLSDRTPKQIIACMEAFAKAAKNGTEWLQNWTMNTVRLKLPEFLSGVLTLDGAGSVRDQQREERLVDLNKELESAAHVVTATENRLAQLSWQTSVESAEETDLLNTRLAKFKKTVQGLRKKIKKEEAQDVA